jgi:hypothetical protein
MKDKLKYLWMMAGLLVGCLGTSLYYGPVRVAEAAGDCRHEDYIMCTGRVSNYKGEPRDGVWILDYRSGKLLGTMVDHNSGKIFGFAEVDLVKEFALKPKQNVHFMMTTGATTKDQDALYLVETSTGKMGVYTMGPQVGGPTTGIAIRRHDMVFFRQPDAK